MAKVHLGEFAPDLGTIEIEARNLFDLVGQVEARVPGFAEKAELKAVFAADGIVVVDWSQPLSGTKEILVIPRVSGG